MKGLLIISLAIWALASATDQTEEPKHKSNQKNEQKSKRSFEAQILPALSLDSEGDLFSQSPVLQPYAAEEQFRVNSGIHFYHQEPVLLSNPVHTYAAEEHVKVSPGTHSYRYITKQVPVRVPKPIPVEVIKKVAVPTPYEVLVPRPYAVPIKVSVPYEVPKSYAVQVPHRVPVAVHERVPVEVPKPYPVYKTKEVKVEIEKPVFVKERIEVKVPVPKPYPVEVPTAVHVKVPHQIVLKVPQVVFNQKPSCDVQHSTGFRPVQTEVGTRQFLDVPNYIYGLNQNYGSYGQQFSQGSFPQQSVFGQQVELDGQYGQNLGQQTVSGFSESNYGQGFQSQTDISNIPTYEQFLEQLNLQTAGAVNPEKESVSVGSFQARSGFADVVDDEKKESNVVEAEKKESNIVEAEKKEADAGEAYHKSETTSKKPEATSESSTKAVEQNEQKDENVTVPSSTTDLI